MKTNKRTKFWWARQVIKFFFIAAVAILLYRLTCYGLGLHLSYNSIWGRILCAATLLIGAWIIITISHKLMQSSIVKIITFFALFLYGVYVYNIGGATRDDWWSSILLPMNNTLSIFFPSRGAYDNELKSGFSDISLLYTSVHLLSYLYIAMLGISLFGRKVMNRYTNIFIRPRYKNIFWGYSDGGVLLAQDIMSKTLCNKAVFIMPENIPLSIEMEHYRFVEIDDIEGIVLYKDLTKQIKRPRGRRHFFLTEDQDLNVKLAFMVLENIKKHNECWFIRFERWLFHRKPVTKLYVRTELTHVDRYFTKVLKSLNGTAEVHTINESELTARRFIQKYPPLDMPGIANTIDTETAKVNGYFKILQLGYGWTGKAVLNKIICNAQFKGKSTFSATVFDKDLKTHHGFYPLLDEDCFNSTEKKPNYYGITTKCNIAIGSIEFKKWVEDNIVKNQNNFNRIVVALGDDALNVKVALSIANLLNGKGMSYEESSKLIFAHIRNTDCCTYFDLDVTPISVFGNKDKIYTMGIIINDELDELAKEMNYYYTFKSSEEYKTAKISKKYKTAKLSQWHKASVLDQESSRAAALAIDNTLRLCGYIKTNEKNVIPADKNAVKTRLNNELLWINEHNRWNAFHFTQGIKRWTFDQINYDIFKGDKPKPNVIDKLNRHAALVAFEHLPLIDKIFDSFRARYNKELERGYCAPYNFKTVKCNFKKIKLTKQEPAENIPLQENDERFVSDAAIIAGRIGYKIVEIDKIK